MYAKKRIEEIVNGVCSMHSADYDLDYLLGYSSVKNDSATTDFVFREGERIVGKDDIIAIPIGAAMHVQIVLEVLGKYK